MQKSLFSEVQNLQKGWDTCKSCLQWGSLGKIWLCPLVFALRWEGDRCEIGGECRTFGSVEARYREKSNQSMRRATPKPDSYYVFYYGFFSILI